MSWESIEKKDITVYFSRPKVLFNGNEIVRKDDAFIYDGRIYVPLRQLAEALSLEVSWNSAANEATLAEQSLNTAIEPCDPFKGESFVYGQIVSIDYYNRTIHIEQHFDDDSREIFEALQVDDDASIVIRRRDKHWSLEFKDVKVGDVVSLVLTRENAVRSMEIDI
jgi:hypothetical protein